jgi:lipoprotein-releasing system permease protein
MKISKLTFSWFIAQRFRKAKRQNTFVSFVSHSSTIGIALGCFVLILLLSVMNGFEEQLRVSLLAKVPQAELIDAQGSGIKVTRQQLERYLDDSRVKHVFTLNKASGLLQKSGKMKAIELMGVDASYLKQKFSIDDNANPFTDTLNNPRANKSSELVLSSGIAETLSLQTGDSVQLLLPSITQDLSFKAPKVINLTVVDIISLGGELDNFLGVMDKAVLGEILSLEKTYTTIEFVMHDPFVAYDYIREIGYGFPQAVYMSDWTRTHGHLYQDIQLVRVVVYIALALVICVASFNIVSSLVMLVKEKQSEIAILKTMGVSEKSLAQIFILQGFYNGIIGSSTGSIIGVITSIYLSDSIEFIQQVLGFKVLEDGIYFVDFLPSKIILTDVLFTFLIALTLSVIATIYPAKKAAKIDPARALH